MILLSLALVVASATTLAVGIFSDSDPLVWTSLGAGLGAVALVAGSVVRRRRLVTVPGAGGSPAGAVAVGPASPGVAPAPSLTPYRSAPAVGPPPPPGNSRPGPQSWPRSTAPPGGASAPDAPRSGRTGPAVPPTLDPARPPAAADPAAPPPDDGGTGIDDGGEPGIEDVPVRDALRVAQLADEVVVVDGHPRYHLTGCPTLDGAERVPLAVSAARRAGFTPCAVCAPDGTLLRRSRDRTAERPTDP